MATPSDFQSRIDVLDPGLFEAVLSGTSPEDRTALLGLQKATRDLKGEYVYLEIGSHLGGSLQSHLLDPRCRRIYSIDKRPADQPDERGMRFPYPENSTQRMLDGLRAIAPGEMGKLVCFDADAREIDPARVVERPDLCFIDGEHTNRAVVSDFRFCHSVCAPDAVIAFHDANIVHEGIRTVEAELRKSGMRFKSGLVGGVVYVIALGDSKVVSEPNAPEAGPEGGYWLLEPDVEALGRTMRAVFEHSEEARVRGRRASAYVRDHLTWRHARDRVIERLQALRGTPVRRAQDEPEEREPSAVATPEGERRAGPSTVVVVLPGAGDCQEAAAARARFTEVPVRTLSGAGPLAERLNRELASLESDAVVLLREDAVVTEGWLDHLVDHLAADPSVAVAGPRLPVGPDGQRTKVRYRSTKKELRNFARTMYQQERGRCEDVGRLDRACVAVRMEAWRALEGFEAAFATGAFLDDFARQCRRMGKRVVCAMDTFVHCAEGAPDEAEAREQRAVACLETGDRHRARGEAEASLACYREALAAKADYLEVTLVLSSTLLEAGRGGEAVGLFQDLEARHPDSSRVKNYLGRCLYQAGRVEEARACFERAIALDPAFSESYSNLGVLLWDSGALDAALAQLKRAAELTPDHPDVVYNIGMIYAQLGQAKQASGMLRHYLASQPEDWNARVYLAILCLENVEGEAGLAELERVLKAQPDHVEALKVLAQLQEAVGVAGPAKGGASHGAS